jgi:hypothetical protein
VQSQEPDFFLCGMLPADAWGGGGGCLVLVHG